MSWNSMLARLRNPWTPVKIVGTDGLPVTPATGVAGDPVISELTAANIAALVAAQVAAKFGVQAKDAAGNPIGITANPWVQNQRSLWTEGPVAVSDATACPTGGTAVNFTAGGLTLAKGRRLAVDMIYTKTGSPGAAFASGAFQYSLDNGTTWFTVPAYQGYDGATKLSLGVRSDSVNHYELRHPIPIAATNVKFVVTGGDGSNYITVTLYARAFEPYTVLA